MTINLENRREIDFGLIKNAAGKHPRTFTELLHITKLSRKTLSLRLRDLCANGALIKENGMYKLNGLARFKNNSMNFVGDFSRKLKNGRMRTGLMLTAFLLCSLASGYALAAFLSNVHQEPVILGELTLALNVYNVRDLYSWQISITFNPEKWKVIEILPGEFVGTTPLYSIDETNFDGGIFMSAMEAGEGILVLGGSLIGSVSGKDGNGTLATIVFGYYTNDYEESMPTIAIEEKGFPTMLLDSRGLPIPIEDLTTLTLTLIKNQ